MWARPHHRGQLPYPTAPWRLAFVVIIWERLTTGQRWNLNLTDEREAAKVMQGRDSSFIESFSLPVLCSFHSTGKDPKQRRESESWRLLRVEVMGWGQWGHSVRASSWHQLEKRALWSRESH